MFDGLESESLEIRQAASAAIFQSYQVDRQKVAVVVEKYLPVNGREGTVRDSILLLGKLRAAEYAPLLARHLTFEAYYKNTKRPQTTEDLYPAVAALIDIGSPAVTPVLERLKREDGEVLERTGAAVLHGVLGSKWATVILEYELRAADQQDVRERLQRLLQRLLAP